MSNEHIKNFLMNILQKKWVADKLCSDEAKMLKKIRECGMMPIIKFLIAVDPVGEIDVLPYFSDICYRVRCEYPQKFPEYLDNLHRHGLVDIEIDRHFTNDDYYEKLKKHPECKKINAQLGQKIVEKKSVSYPFLGLV